MSFFNFFKKAVVLHCYTDKPDVYNFSAIKESKNFIPDWWKKTPKGYTPNSESFAPKKANTIKGCDGFIDLYRQGAMLPMWSDCEVTVGEIGSGEFRYQYSNGYSVARSHPEQQRGMQYPERDYLHLKFEPEWCLVCEEDINFLVTAPVWNHDSPESLIVFPGVLNFKYQTAININVLFKRENSITKYLVPFGLPIAHLIPLTERKLVVKTYLVSSDTLKRIHSITAHTTFAGKYRNNKKIMQKNKCPFSTKVES
jgi:hypothetical protein